MTSPELKAATEQDLLARSIAGDREAFGELVTRHQPQVLALVESLLRNHHAAESVTQETFAKVLDLLQRSPPTSIFSGWLLQVARRMALDHLRRKRPLSVPIEGSPMDHTDEVIDRLALQMADEG